MHKYVIEIYAWHGLTLIQKPSKRPKEKSGR
jgi:hypothetical protein